MAESIIQPANFIDFSITPVGNEFGPTVIGTDFLHGNLIFVGCSPAYSFIDFGWTPQSAQPAIGTYAWFNYTFGCSPPNSFIDFGWTPRGSAISARAADTHDGVKKKKKKKPVDLLAEEVARREKLRKQIEEVIHPTIVEVVPVEEKEEEVAHGVIPVELKSLETPIIDYASLARQQIVAKIQDDAQRELQRQLELKRLEDEEEERELMMILDSIL